MGFEGVLDLSKTKNMNAVERLSIFSQENRLRLHSHSYDEAFNIHEVVQSGKDGVSFQRSEPLV